MKIQTKTLYGALFMALLIAVPMVADARPFGQGCEFGDWGWSSSIPEDKRSAFSALMLEHQEKVQPIHDKLWVKRTTLDALQGNPNVKPAELTALIEEMAAIRTQLLNEHNAFVSKVKKETGLDMPFGRGMYGAGFMRHYNMGGQGCAYGGPAGGRGWHHGGRGMR